jgi:hypothetical protein
VTLTELFFHGSWYGCPCILAARVTSIPLAARFQLPRSPVNNIDCFTAGTICVTHSDAGILTRQVNVRFGREEPYAGFVGSIGIPECQTSWYCRLSCIPVAHTESVRLNKGENSADMDALAIDSGSGKDEVLIQRVLAVFGPAVSIQLTIPKPARR